MTDTQKKKPSKKFERKVEAMPELVAEAPEPGTAPSDLEPRAPESHSVRVSKLDQQTVWRVIEMLKSL